MNLFLGFIDIFSMCDSNNVNDKNDILYSVQYPIISLSYSLAFFTGQFLAAAWSRICGQGIDS
jgi:hypothetical protein